MGRGRWGSSRMCVIEKQTGPGEQEEEEEEEKSASKPRFHAQGWNKSFQGTPLTLMLNTQDCNLKATARLSRQAFLSIADNGLQLEGRRSMQLF